MAISDCVRAGDGERRRDRGDEGMGQRGVSLLRASSDYGTGGSFRGAFSRAGTRKKGLDKSEQTHEE
jgi:hypothetical protein